MDSKQLLGATALALSLSIVGCVQTPSIDNDRFASALADAGKSGDDEGSDDDDTTDDPDETPVKDAAKPTQKDSSEPATTGDAESPTESDAEAPVSTDDGGAPMDTPDAGPVMMEPEPVMSVVPGSATTAKCSSYGKASGTMCAGYYCGVTQEQIAAEMPADNICGDNAVQGACDNKLPTAVAKCARDVKSANALASNAQNRPKVQDCVFKDADLKAKTPLPCMSCFLDAAECAGDNCLVECLAGDSKSCDTCRAKNKCDLKVFTCAKLISPF